MRKTDDHRDIPQTRRISGPLMLGLLAMPLVFGWFLARSGYKNSTRTIVSVYALLAPVAAILSALG